jgi:hypothetical protein
VYVNQILVYLTYNSEIKPFPLLPFPSPAESPVEPIEPVEEQEPDTSDTSATDFTAPAKNE